ncbi:MAG: phage portal protein [Pirellulales bacterium]
MDTLTRDLAIVRGNGSRDLSAMVEEVLTFGGSAAAGMGARIQGGLTPHQQANSLSHWVFVCVNRIRMGVAATLLRTYDRLADGSKSEVTDPDDPFNWLMANPNQYDTRIEFWATAITFLELTGNSLWLKVRDRLHVVRELWPIPSQYIRPHSEDGKSLTCYAMEGGAVGSVPIPLGDIVHLRYPNPQDRFWGLGTLAAASIAMRATDKIKANQLAAFDNEILSQMYFSTDQQFANEDAWKRQMALIRNRYSSTGKSRVPMLFEAGVKPGFFNRSPAEMDYRDSAAISRDEILSIFGVPPLLAGIVENANNSNTSSQETVFGQYTLAPRCGIIQERINKDLAPEFGKRKLAEFDNPTPRDRVTQCNLNTRYVSAGILTPNDVRFELGYEPMPWGEKPRWVLESEARSSVNVAALPPSRMATIITRSQPTVAEDVRQERYDHAQELYDYHTVRLQRELKRLLSAQRERVLANVLRLFSHLLPPGEAGRSLPCPSQTVMRRKKVFVFENGKGFARLFVDGTAYEEHRTLQTARLGRPVTVNRCHVRGEWETLLVRVLGDENEERLDDWLKAADDMANALLPKIQNALADGGGIQAGDLGFGGSFNLRSPAAEEWLRGKQRDYWLGTVQETTKKLLSEKLANVMQEGPTLKKLEVAVEDVMGGRIVSSAETIARTEAVGAYGAGADIVRTERGVKLKEWIATHDARTRGSHYAADGQKVKQSESFLIGSSRLKHPGDPAGPASQIVNCRCTAVAVIDDDDLGEAGPVAKPKGKQPKKPKPEAKQMPKQFASQFTLEAANGIGQEADVQAGLPKLAGRMEKNFDRLEELRLKVVELENVLKAEVDAALRQVADSDLAFGDLLLQDPKKAESYDRRVRQPAIKRYNRLKDRQTRKLAEVGDEAHKQLFSHVAARGTPIGRDLNIVGRVADKHRTSVNQGKAFLRKAVDARYAEAGPIEIADTRPGQRSHFTAVNWRPGNATKHAIHLEDGEDAAIVVHEYAHAIEIDPEARRMSRSFLASRTKDSVFKKLKDVFPSLPYMPHEIGADDDFSEAFGGSAWYVGKYYPTSTEIVSMGLQKMYEDPVGLAKHDPEYFRFLTGILDGSLVVD